MATIRTNLSHLVTPFHDQLELPPSDLVLPLNNSTACCCIARLAISRTLLLLLLLKVMTVMALEGPLPAACCTVGTGCARSHEGAEHVRVHLHHILLGGWQAGSNQRRNVVKYHNY